MPTVSVDLDEALHDWLCRRARTHDTSVAVELAALAADARARETAETPATKLPLGIYEADDGTTVVELGDPEVDEADLPVGIYHDRDRDREE